MIKLKIVRNSHLPKLLIIHERKYIKTYQIGLSFVPDALLFMQLIV
jgi:hypothetical protein